MTDYVATSTEVRLSEITKILTSFPLCLKRSVFSVVTLDDRLSGMPFTDFLILCTLACSHYRENNCLKQLRSI